MAVPASANSLILNGGSDVWFVEGDISVPVPPSVPFGVPTFLVVDDDTLTVLYSDDLQFYSSTTDTGIRYQSFTYKSIFSVSSGLWSKPSTSFVFNTSEESVLLCLRPGIFMNDIALVQELSLPSSFHVGILSVFSGVGSWLSGAVQNISTMFWTAESGMSVLGYLAVASLALAVILLVFYLIAGWLKFH